VSEPATSASSLIEGARRDLASAEALLSRDGDRLLALVALARAARRADDATFAALDEGARRHARSVPNTHRGYGRLALSEREEKRRSR